MVMIGIDPHKRTHTAVAIDTASGCSTSGSCGRGRAGAGAVGVGQAPRRRRADLGDRVRRRARLPVGPAAPRRRRAGRGHPGDVGVAGAAVGHGPVGEERPERRPVGRDRRVAGGELVPVRVEDHATVLRLLARRHTPAGLGLQQDRLPAPRAGGGLVPGGIGKEVVVSQARSLLETTRAGRGGRHRTAPPGRRDARRARAARHPTQGLRRRGSAPRSPRRGRPSPRSSGSVTSAPRSFRPGRRRRPVRTADRFAAYNGTAPIEWSSGNPKRPIHRLSRRGNRTLNHVIHIAAVTQLRHRAQPRPRVLRPQARRGHDRRSSDPRVEATHQQRRLPAPRRRRRHAQRAERVREGNQGRLSQSSVAG